MAPRPNCFLSPLVVLPCLSQWLARNGDRRWARSANPISLLTMLITWLQQSEGSTSLPLLNLRHVPVIDDRPGTASTCT